MKKLTVKRTIAGLLTALMLVTLMPTTAFAAEHTHSWTYTRAGQYTVTAQCANSGCSLSPVSLTASAPANPVYNGEAKPITISNYDPAQGMSATITYLDSSYQKLPGAPTEVGTYTASITFPEASLELGYSITAAVVTSVTLDVIAPVAGQAPQSAILAGTGYTATISWAPADATFLYNTAYTATVTLTAKDGYSFDAGLNVAGWSKSGTAQTLVFTKTFTATEKETVTAVTAPAPADKFVNRYASAATAIASLPATTTITVGGRSETLAIEWACDNYNTADNAANTFAWSVANSLAAKGYIAADNLTVSGSVTILNADKAVDLDKSVTGFALIWYGQTWADVDYSKVFVNAPGQDHVTVPGTWEFLNVQPTARPEAEGPYLARFTPNDTATYAILECYLELRFLSVNPIITIKTDKDPAKYYPTETVNVTISANNPYFSDWHVPDSDITITYQIGDAAAQPLTNGKFALPTDAEGKTVTITVVTAAVGSQYTIQTKTLAFTINNRSAVNNAPLSATIPYTNTHDVSQLFSLDPNAGTPSYTLLSGSSIAKLNGTTLTISGIGVIEIRLDTAATGIYAADSDVATLTVEKGNGSGSVSISGWTFGESANAPVPTSSTNGTAGVTYLYEGVDTTVYAASATAPTKAGHYKVTATFPENALYKSFTASAAFTIGKATPTLGTVGCQTTLYDTTAPGAVVLTRTDNTVPGTLKLIGVTELEIGTKSYAYEFTPDNTDDYLSTTGTVALTVVKDVAEQLTISGTLTNTAYTHGDTLDPTGLTLTAVYSSGITMPVDTNDVDVVCPTLSAGQTTASIAYRGVTASVSGFTVAKAQLDVSGISWEVGSYTYNGSEQGPTLKGTLPTGVVATTTGDKKIVAGSYTASVTFSLDATHSADHYEIVGAVADCTWSIAKASAQISGVTAADATYDSTAKVGYTGTPTGDYTGTYTITYEGSGATSYAASENAPVHAGEYTVTFTIPDTDDRYYGKLTLSFTIEKATVTVTADDLAAFVAHPAPTLTYSVSGLFGTDTLITPPTLTTDVDMDVAGTYTVSASGADAGNDYTISYVDGTITVTRAQGSGSVSISGWTYGQTPNAPVPSSSTNGTTGVTYLYEGTANDGTSYSSATAPTLAGSYTVCATFPETTLYAEYVSDKVAFTIAKAVPAYTTPATLTASYGDTLSDLTLPTGFHWSVSENTHVGSVGTSYFSAHFIPEDTANYQSVYDISVSVSVSSLNIAASLVLINSTPVYDGTEQSCDFYMTKINGQTPTIEITGNTATNAGKYTMTLTGTGNFSGKTTVEWEIKPCDIRTATVTLGSPLTYTGAAQTQSIASVKIDGLNVTYTVSAGNTATDVGVYELTIKGTGNFTGECSVRWTIAPDTTKIDPLTPENVTSADRDDILEVLDSIKTEEAKREWEDVVDKCEELLEAIENSARTIDDILAALDAYDIDTVKSPDKTPIERLAKEIDYLLNDGNLTPEEINALRAGADKADALLDRIAEVAAKMADILDRLSKYHIDTVKSTDQADIEAIQAEIDALLNGQNLTPDEREDMVEAKDYTYTLLNRIREAYAQANTDWIERAKGITEETVSVTDRKTLENAVNDLERAIELYPGNYTTAERTEIDEELARLKALLAILDKIAAVQEKIDALPDSADPSDTAAQDQYNDAKNAYDALADQEKALIDTGKLDKLAGLLSAYQIIEGKDGIWVEPAEDGLVFVANGTLTKFTELLVDGTVVATASYTPEAPMTTLTLKAEYLATLTQGEHELTVRYADGEASCKFSVDLIEEDTPEQEKDGWGWILVILLILLFIIGGAIIFFLIYKKKEEETSNPVDPV